MNLYFVSDNDDGAKSTKYGRGKVFHYQFAQSTPTTKIFMCLHIAYVIRCNCICAFIYSANIQHE